MFKFNINTSKPIEIINILNKIGKVLFMIYFKGIYNKYIFEAKIIFQLRITEYTKFKIEKISIQEIKILFYKKKNINNPYLEIFSTSDSTCNSDSSEEKNQIEKKIYNIIKNIIKDISLKKSIDNKTLGIYLVKQSEIKKLKIKGKYKEN